MGHQIKQIIMFGLSSAAFLSRCRTAAWRVGRLGVWLVLSLAAMSTPAVVLWSDLGTTLAHETGPGRDILGGALKRDDASADTLYFKVQVEPISDAATEEYFAAFELYEGDNERLGVGNALKAWAYSALFNLSEGAGSNRTATYVDLRSARPEPGGQSSYELPRRGRGRTILFKIQFVPDHDDLVTVWLDPDLSAGAHELSQPESLTTRFIVNASFDEVRLRHGGAGEGWIFSGMAIATAFADFVDTSSAKPGSRAPSPNPDDLRLSFHAWQQSQGMPHGPIRALAQTRDGYLWLGGDDSLARFDGVRFVPVGAPKGLPHQPIRVLFGDRAGALWIGTEGGGLVRYRAGRFDGFTTLAGLPSDAITALAEDRDGRLWVGTRAGLSVGQNDHWAPLPEAARFNGQAIVALWRDRKDTLWMAVQNQGVFQHQNGQFVQVDETSTQGLLRDPHCLLVDRVGRIWVGAGDDFLLCREGEQWRRFRVPRHTTRPLVKVLAEEPDGTVWAGSVSEGLFQFRGGKLKGINAGTGLSDNLVHALLVDGSGHLWVGSEYGLNRLRRNDLFAFGQEEGLGYGAVGGMAEVAPGVLWAAKPNDGLYRWDGPKFSRLTAAGLPLQDPAMGAMLVTRDGHCLVACAHGLLRFKDPQAVADESQPAGLANQSVISLAEDAQRQLWAGTRDGKLWRLAQGTWLQLTNWVDRHPITALAPLPDGSLWIGTDGAGLYRRHQESLTHYDKGSGLAGSSVATLYPGADGTLWIGMAGAGLSWWRAGTFANVTTREGLPDDTVAQILEDTAGRLWLGTRRGIARVRRHELEETAAGKTAGLFPRVYGRAEGMPSEECTTGFFPAGLRSRSGVLWFSTLMGLVAAQPQARETRGLTPAVVLEAVAVDGVAAKPAGSAIAMLRIPAGKHRLEVQYTGLGFDLPEETRFRYRLDGLDTDWVEAGTRRTAFYNYVPPGDYRFRVSASDNEGYWTQAGADLRVVVARHFWQSWWVLGPSVLLLVGAIAGAARLVERGKMQRRLKRLEQDRLVERERTRIAQDLHDEMGAKLCRISFLSEHARRSDRLTADLSHQIGSISDASREVLHSLDEIVWAINPQNDTLEQVVSYVGQYAQEYFQMTGVECEVSAPARVPPRNLSSQARHHLFLATQEAFTNILKHAGATRVRVTMDCSGPGFQMTTVDNGRGFDPAATGAAAEAGGSRDGLINMRQRLADIGGECRVESAPGHGTTIQFRVPFPEPVAAKEK